jgi:lysophospholipase L1-like esterase
VAGAALLLSSGCAVWRVGQSIDLARQSEPWQQMPERAVQRMLVVGDSTAVGTGASGAERSLAGLIGRSHPGLLIENRAKDGARFADVAAQLVGNERFDIVLVQAGGNDVIRMRGLDAMRADIDLVVGMAGKRADVVLLMPAGNVGNAPFFFPPLSWWMTQRSRSLHQFVADAASRSGAVYVNLFHEREADPFVADKSLNASDGLHPSDAGYRLWLNELTAQADLARRLSRAAGG